jgi:uncharacterized LabA/DUF88 family protein
LHGLLYLWDITHLQLAAGSKAARERSFSGLCFMAWLLRTIAYIDGFNLYYRMLKARPAMKWLNPKALIGGILHPSYTVTRINYYTARVSARAHDPDAPARQATYLKALSTIPEIAVHAGNFLTSEPWMPLASPPQARPDGYVWSLPPPSVVQVIKSEEKGSDVNLGAHLVRDAFINAFDVAVVLTNDSDLVEPIRVATVEAGKRVGLLVPVKYPTPSLTQVASFSLHIRPGHLSIAQFPADISRPDGTVISKPAAWV